MPLRILLVHCQLNKVRFRSQIKNELTDVLGAQYRNFSFVHSMQFAIRIVAANIIDVLLSCWLIFWKWKMH